jgi:WD40 repeat protein
MGTVRLHQGGPIAAVAFAPDGKTLASAAHQDPRVYLWDAATGKAVRQFPGAASGNRAVGFSPDGQILAAAGGHTVWLWEVASGKELRHITTETFITCMALAPTGKTLATAGTRTLSLWDVATGMELRRFEGHDYVTISALAFSPDGRTLATKGFDRTARANKRHESTIRLWEAATGKELRRFGAALGPVISSVGVEALAFSPDGKLLASGDGALRLWDTAEGKEVRRIDGAGIVAFSPDGKRLASGVLGGTALYLWDTATGKELRRVEGRQGNLSSLAFSPDGKLLALGGYTKAIRLLEIATGKDALPSRGKRLVVHCVAYSPDGRTLATGGADPAVCLWDAATGKQVRTLGRSDADSGSDLVFGIAFSPDGKTLAAGGLDRTIRLWETATGKELEPWMGHHSVVRAVGFSSDGKRLVSAGTDAVCLWEVATGKEIRQLQGLAECVAISPNGRLVASADQGKAFVRLWTAATGEELWRLSTRSTISGLVFSPDGKTLFTGGHDGIQLWEVASGKERDLRKAFVVSRTGCPSLALSPDGQMLAWASFDRMVSIAEASTGRLLGRLEGHHAAVFAVAFAPDCRTLASGSDDATALVWDISGLVRRDRPRPAVLTAKALDGMWADLGDEDAAKAYQAIRTLASDPDQAVPFLRKRLKPAAIDPRIEPLIAELDSDQFKVREKAEQELDMLADRAEPALRKALKNPATTLEARRRLERIVDRLEKNSPHPEFLRLLRVVEVLEGVGTAAAREVLANLAKGVPQARLTQEAKAALQRIARRPATGR